jgi:hypothetical protein
MPPFLRTNWSSGSASGLYAAGYLITRDHLLRVRLSALAGSAVHRMTAANGPSCPDTSNRRKRSARLTSLPSAAPPSYQAVDGVEVTVDRVAVAVGLAVVPGVAHTFQVLT